jgi:hypothetical protein
MKKMMIGSVLALSLMAGPAFSEMSKHDDAMCTKHCNIMDLQKKVDSLKSQQNTADKTATKEHLRKDIEVYEKKLQEIKQELEATK